MSKIKEIYSNYKWRVWRKSKLYHIYLCWLKNKVERVEGFSDWKRNKHVVRRSSLFNDWEIVQQWQIDSEAERERKVAHPIKDIKEDL